VNANAVAEGLRSQEAVRRAIGALGDSTDVWIVGGAVRDAALGREVTDIDLAVAGSAKAVAEKIAAATGGAIFELSAAYETWRAMERGGAWQVDVTRLRGDSIEEDLGLRDFTIGAVAVPLAAAPLLDPLGGLGDLAQGTLRAVSGDVFADDPLRLLRAARLAAELRLEIDPETVRLARSHSGTAATPAGERQLTELRLLIGGPDPLRGIRLMEELGVTAAVLPELEALRGVEQGPNHHLDVYEHTLAVLENLLEVEGELPRYAGERAGDVAALMGEPLADGFTRRDALRFGALFHDIGKPQTRGDRSGFVTFIGHDSAGAEIVGQIGGRLRASRRLSSHVAALADHHLHLGFMVSERPLSPRRVHQYLRLTGDVAADVTLLTVADRLSARGTGSTAAEAMIQGHLELAREMLAAALDWRRDGPPRPLLPGDELAAELEIERGPSLGPLLAALEAAQYAGEVSTREQAIEHARALLGG